MSVSFGAAVASAAAAGRLVVQPRMGFAGPAEMRAGLLATKYAAATTVGTITVDSYTRVGDHAAARAAVKAGEELNGYPIVAHGRAVTRTVLADVLDDSFPVQVRHGSADPRAIVAALLEAGLHATEGGPVSYCLPYSRMPLAEAVDHWARACELLAGAPEPHLETFGGCMLGQLCPPALLVALSVLEGLFFAQHGLRCISFSYAQQTNADQDREAVAALRRLVAELLPDVRSHVVVYTYMGVYPRTPHGARELLAESARLAVAAGAARLVVKTTAEAYRIPTVAENVAALAHAAQAAAGPVEREPVADTGIYAQARAMVDAVRELSGDVGSALREAFARGYLDVPYCLHPDNAGRTRSYLDHDGWLLWQRTGSLPIRHATGPAGRMTADGLAASLAHVQHTFDRAPLRTG